MSSNSNRSSSSSGWYGGYPAGQIMPPRPPSHTGTATDRTSSFADRLPNSELNDWIQGSTPPSATSSSMAHSLTYGPAGNSAMGQIVRNQSSLAGGSSSSGNDWAASRTAQSDRSLTDGSPNSASGSWIRGNTPSATSSLAPGSSGYGYRGNSAMGQIVSNEPSQVSGKEPISRQDRSSLTGTNSGRSSAPRPSSNPYPPY
uniref:Uncharacterized protein n=1 Tax=Kalanchoe fedtschenkoi TaxID=63787 RepID=A0A7N0RCD7_KALFE